MLIRACVDKPVRTWTVREGRVLFSSPSPFSLHFASRSFKYDARPLPPTHSTLTAGLRSVCIFAIGSLACIFIRSFTWLVHKCLHVHDRSRTFLISSIVHLAHVREIHPKRPVEDLGTSVKYKISSIEFIRKKI